MRIAKRCLSLLLLASLLATMLVGAAVQAAALDTNDDYRAWSHRDSRWSSKKMGDTYLGNGGSPTTAVTKLAIQAGLRDAHDFNVGDMATLLDTNGGYSGSAIVWNTPTKASLNLFSSKDVFYDNKDGIAVSDKVSTIRTKISDGWHLVLKVKSRSGDIYFVPVDEKLTKADGSNVYIMDCTTNYSNNTNVNLTTRFTKIYRITGYRGDAAQSSSINNDYRKWELNNTNWASTVLNGSNTINNSYVGGGDLLLVATKLAIQAGAWSKETEGGVNSVNRAAAAVSSESGFSAGGVTDLTKLKTALNFSSYDDENINANNIIDKLNEGYYIALKVNNSAGWIAVDSEKTLAEEEVYIMRSTPTAAKNADIKLGDYYNAIEAAVGFKVDGVKVKFSGNATFSATYTSGGDPVSFSSGAFVPNGATVSITATPKVGYTAADAWAITGGSLTAHDTTSCSFTVSAATTVTYTPTASSQSISYSYVDSSGAELAGDTLTAFNSYNKTTPSSAPTGETVTMSFVPLDTDTVAFELVIDAVDANGGKLDVTQVGTDYKFKMPGYNVSVTVKVQDVDDWRKWARVDSRWASETIVSTYTIQSSGAAIIGLTKLGIQAAQRTPTTLTEENFDPKVALGNLKTNS